MNIDARIIREVAKKERVETEKLRTLLSEGKVVIPCNPKHSPIPLGIGEGLRVKVNANIGTSLDYAKPEEELEKARIAVKYGADAVMDLSIGGDIERIRRMLLKELRVPFGTVPIYQAGMHALEMSGAIIDMDEDDMFNAIEAHAKDGVDFAVTHVGVTKESVARLKKQHRLLEMVSRGGSFHAAWMVHHGKENPLYQNYDYLLDIASRYEMTLSLGDGMRSGCVADANDRAKIQELLIIGELVERARKKGVQAMVEGPGHMPMNTIGSNIRVMKSVTKGAPYYVLGPLVTDIAPGYDHIVAAIGGAIAGYEGVDFLCYVTPSEHLCLPDVNDVKEVVIASRIAAHAADLAKGRDTEWDYRMSKFRKELDWKGMFSVAIDQERAMDYRRKRRPARGEVCSMCGDVCAIRIVRDYLEKQG